MTHWVLTLPIAITGKNAVPRNPHARKRLRDGYAAMLKVLARDAEIPCVVERAPWKRGESTIVRPVPVRAVTLVRLIGKGQRVLDDGDGLTGGAFVLLRDAMQPTRYRWRKGQPHPIGVVPGAGIVVDDSAKWSRWTYAQERAADGKAGVRIEIEDVQTAGETSARSE